MHTSSHLNITSVVGATAFSKPKAAFVLFPALSNVHSERPVAQKLLDQKKDSA